MSQDDWNDPGNAVLVMAISGRTTQDDHTSSDAAVIIAMNRSDQDRQVSLERLTAGYDLVISTSPGARPGVSTSPAPLPARSVIVLRRIDE